MSAYGGYSNDTGGGFYTGSQGGSQGGGGGQKNYQDESLRPLTAKQVLDAEQAYPDADIKVDGTAVTQVTLVGQVRSINPQPTNVTIRIDDGTGSLEIKKFIDIDKAHEAENPGFEVDSHVRVYGRLKSYSDKRYVGANFIRPVKDHDEVNYHMLEATYVHLYYTRGPLGENGAGPNGNANNDGGMFVDGGAGAGDGGGANAGKLTGCSVSARKVHNFMNNAAGGNEGVHLNVISQGAGLSVKEVLSAADELLGHGLIYTTVDDETWAILEY